MKFIVEILKTVVLILITAVAMLIVPISLIMLFISVVLPRFLSNCSRLIDKQLDNIFLALLDDDDR